MKSRFLKAPWLCHQLMVLGSHLGTDSNEEQIFKGTVAMSSANGIGFASRYRLQPRTGF